MVKQLTRWVVLGSFLALGLSSLAGADEKTTTAPVPVEYKVIQLQRPYNTWAKFHPESLASALNAQAKSGWRLVSVVPGLPDDDYVGIFERPL
jgi:hypothetical protein